jgi:hypothetical protein
MNCRKFVFLAVVVAAFAPRTSHSQTDAERLASDAMTYVDKPCTAPDQNPVCWAKTYLACTQLDWKYCSMIGLKEKEGSKPVEDREPLVEGEDGWPADWEVRERGPLKAPPWQMRLSEVIEWVQCTGYDVDFHGLVAVGPERFMRSTDEAVLARLPESERHLPPPPDRLRGDFELRLFSYIGAAADPVPESFFFQHTGGRWSLVSRRWDSIIIHEDRYDEMCNALHPDCATYVLGITPFPELGARTDGP